ncbi:hypothetical protein ACFFX0_32145 [Citricoccus parietis]|uniref:Uncharacterized protein n=1 Tax=Citricoccus parietis TaxID=592307 RepID=A0ABV5G9D7_9MICC
MPSALPAWAASGSSLEQAASTGKAAIPASPTRTCRRPGRRRGSGVRGADPGECFRLDMTYLRYFFCGGRTTFEFYSL